jgi:hypothetical protein
MDYPFANISRDGKFVAFSSNWGGSSRKDVFVLRIPQSPSEVARKEGVKSSRHTESSCYAFLVRRSGGRVPVVPGASELAVFDLRGACLWRRQIPGSSSGSHVLLPGSISTGACLVEADRAVR